MGQRVDKNRKMTRSKYYLSNATIPILLLVTLHAELWLNKYVQRKKTNEATFETQNVQHEVIRLRGGRPRGGSLPALEIFSKISPTGAKFSTLSGEKVSTHKSARTHELLSLFSTMPPRKTCPLTASPAFSVVEHVHIVLTKISHFPGIHYLGLVSDERNAFTLFHSLLSKFQC